MSASPQPLLTLLYDGACPLCRREVTFLERRDRLENGPSPHLAFVDVDAPDYDPADHGGISYREAMGCIHALEPDGTVLRDVAVFRRAYALIGLGWIYAPTGWPVLGPIADGLYRLWARWRLAFTGRPPLDALCRDRETCRMPAASLASEGSASMGRPVSPS
jgi:predicted DCC family thiol-disulfide oxidoreductase YuxK